MRKGQPKSGPEGSLVRQGSYRIVWLGTVGNQLYWESGKIIKVWAGLGQELAGRQHSCLLLVGVSHTLEHLGGYLLMTHSL